MILNLGCGTVAQPGCVNVDIVDYPGVDVVHDLDVTPWPFPDNQFAQVYAKHVFEHLRYPVAFMQQAHRVLSPGGLLHIEVPDWQSKNAYTDPTHVRFCTDETWDYWTVGTGFHGKWNALYGGVSFHRQDLRVVNGDIYVDLVAA
jgi:SAM-dependent methyltransferase